MRKADEYTIKELGVPEEVLVERAGDALANEISKRYLGGRVLFCVGKGNNGADGKVACRILSQEHGFNTQLCEVYNGDFSLLKNKYDIIVDCIFGTGLNKPVEGKYKECIELINKSHARVISCDIPSGLNGDNGRVMGVAVKANVTVAIQEFKLGHFLNDGIDYCGEVVCRDIGISVWEEQFACRIEEKDCKKFFPPRERNVNKGNFGKVTIFGGSKNFSGSVLLSTTALLALKMGTGYSNLAIPNSMYNAYMGLVPECTFTPIKDDDGSIIFDEDSLKSLLKYDSIAIGMGMGKSKQVYKTLCYLLKNYSGKLVIDADGLNSLAEYGKDVLLDKKCTVILTPHIGEFVRLVNVDKTAVLCDITCYAKNFAAQYGVVLLLKSATSVITDGNQVFINTTGSSCMAKGGSGDVLSGIVAGLVARSTEPCLETVSVASYLFGKAGELAEKDQNVYTPTATDLVKKIEIIVNGYCK